MNQQPSQLPDADMQATYGALLRAAQRAREIARQTGTPLIVVVDGELVELWVDEHGNTTTDPDGHQRTT